MITLQITWYFLIIFLLGMYALLDGFDLGTGFWHLIRNNKKERDHFIDCIGPFWDGNEVWLLTGGGALFAAFPPIYATTFSGFYLAIILLIIGLIFRALSIEFRDKIESKSWLKFWDYGFSFGSMLPAILFGVAMGNVVRGLPLSEAGDYTGTFFQLLNPFSILIGITALSMFIFHSSVFLTLKSKHTQWIKDYKNFINKSSIPYITLAIIALGWSQYLRNDNLLFSLPIGIAGIGFIFLALMANSKNRPFYAFIFSALSVFLNFATLPLSIFPTMIPALEKGGQYLTLYEASSSQNTLTVMLILAIIAIPIILVYTVFLYRTFSSKNTFKENDKQVT